DLYVSPVQMIPSCDQVGVPGLVGFTHFTSSTTSGSACVMSLRILLKVSPRQSPSSAIRLSIRSDADWPSLETDFFIFSSRNFTIGINAPAESHVSDRPNCASDRDKSSAALRADDGQPCAMRTR